MDRVHDSGGRPSLPVGLDVPKACTGCGAEKPLAEFYSDNRTADGRGTRCKVCHEARYKSWKRANQQKVSGYNAKWWQESGARYARYDMTEAEYRAMLAKQGGLCAICRQPERIIIRGRVRPLQIDHSHGHNRVRGLLCSACNTGIGKFRDSPDLLEVAAEYLRTSVQPTVLPIAG